jgi:hypothetical protein
MLAAAVALAMSAGTAFAVMGKTNTDVALRTAPTAHAELILNLPEGTLVNVGRCSRRWCGVTWNKYGMCGQAQFTQALRHLVHPQSPSFPPIPIKRATIRRQTPTTTYHPTRPPTRASIAGAIF